MKPTPRGRVLAALLVDGTVEQVMQRTSLPPDAVAHELRRLCELGVATARLDHDGLVYRLRRAGATEADVELAEARVRVAQKRRAAA